MELNLEQKKPPELSYLPLHETSNMAAAKTQSAAYVRQQQYLILYNLVSAFLWFCVLARVLIILSSAGPAYVHDGVGSFARWVQTLATLEIVHSALGTCSLLVPPYLSLSLFSSLTLSPPLRPPRTVPLCPPEHPARVNLSQSHRFDIQAADARPPTGLVRSPLPTTVMQVFSRVLLVWGIVFRHPAATSPSPFYSSMLIAWALTEVVRYSFFVQNIRGVVPPALVWLRYNLFYILYPVGITSEVVMMWKASVVGEDWERWAIWVVLAGYVPGK
jgi:hypothetical protein